ncbi:MAG: hypothetical protein WCI77_05650 [Candidatus Omnitrophota bacterium]
MDYKRVIFLFAWFFVFIAAMTQTEKLTKLTPRNTELIDRRQQKPEQYVTVTNYKYATLARQDEVVQFYRKMFTNDGFSEVRGYSPDGQSQGPIPQSQSFFFFTKPNTMVMLNLLLQQERGRHIYYVTVNELDSKAAKTFVNEMNQNTGAQEGPLESEATEVTPQE